jgi:hypothetical protein
LLQALREAQIERGLGMSPFDYQTDIFFCEYYQLAQRSMGNTEFHESVDITLGCIYGLVEKKFC